MSAHRLTDPRTESAGAILGRRSRQAYEWNIMQAIILWIGSGNSELKIQSCWSVT
jgi:hypothetical protein